MSNRASPKYINTSHLSWICCQTTYQGFRHPLQIRLPPRPLSSQRLCPSVKTHKQLNGSPLLLYFIFFISMEYCVYHFYSSRSAPRVTAFPGFRCYQVGASIQPSPVCLKMRLEPNDMKKIYILVNISVGKCWSCYCFVCICLYLTLGIFIVNRVPMSVLANKMDTRPVGTDPFTRVTFPLVSGLWMRTPMKRLHHTYNVTRVQ